MAKGGFLNDVFHFAKRDAHFVRDAPFGRDVRFARDRAEHITSFCGKAVKHKREQSEQHHFGVSRNIIIVACRRYIIKRSFLGWYIAR